MRRPFTVVPDRKWLTVCIQRRLLETVDNSHTPAALVPLVRTLQPLSIASHTQTNTHEDSKHDSYTFVAVSSPLRSSFTHTSEPSMSSAPYEIRTNDNGNGRSKKQSMAELKLRRLNELNQRLQEDLNRRRIPVSEASIEYVDSSRTSLCTNYRLTALQLDRIHRQGTKGLYGAKSMGNSKTWLDVVYVCTRC